MRFYQAWGLLSLIFPIAAIAAPKDLPYPLQTELSADEIIAQVYFVNHFYAFKNYGITQQGNAITIVIKRQNDGILATNTVERFLNNGYNDGIIKARDLAIFRSGSLRGTGLLITEYEDDNKSSSYVIWIPTQRRLRRFAEPAQEDAWSGSDFTFGDVYLRKPSHETHELQGQETYANCLGVMEIKSNERNEFMQNLPLASCLPKGRPVYKIKSTAKFEHWWYDYRISYVDTETFADYRTDYFKDGNHIKFIERDWHTAPGYQGKDPRALSWGYWYGKDLANGHESWAVIPKNVVTFDDPNLEESLWTEKTLSKIRN